MARFTDIEPSEEQRGTNAKALADAMRRAAGVAAGMVSPTANSPGAAAISRARSLLPGGDSYKAELAAYNADAAPGLYSPQSVVHGDGLPRGDIDETMAAIGPLMAAQIKDPRLAKVFSPRAAEVLTDPPAPGDFFPAEKWRKAYRDQYVRGENVVANSRLDRFTGEIPPEGTWSVDDVPGIHGREVAQLKRVNPSQLTPTEDIPERLEDAKRYAEWMREGHQAPPLDVIETEKGNFHIINGHRRWNAAKMAGQDVMAWISPMGPHPKGLAAYGQTEPMRVGLTLEMLQQRMRDSAHVPAADAHSEAQALANAVRGGKGTP